MDKLATLRKKLVKAAVANPDQREKLLRVLAALLKRSAEEKKTFDEWVEGKTFTNPDTGNKVQFGSLPADSQKKIRDHWGEAESGGTDDDKDPKEEELLADYNLRIVGDNKKRAIYVAKKMKEGIEKSADICKLSPPVCEGNLGISRDNMPQLMDQSVKSLLNSEDPGDKKKGQAAVDAGADPDSDQSPLEQFLETLKKEGVKQEHTSIPVGELKATQREIKAGKTFKMAHSYFSGEFPKITEGEIIVSSDNHILDGHHRWAAMLVADPTLKMKVIKVDIPMKEFLRRSLEQPGVFRADLQDNVIPEDKEIDLGDGPEKIKKKKSEPKKPEPKKEEGKKEEPKRKPENDFKTETAIGQVDAGIREMKDETAKEKLKGFWKDLQEKVEEGAVPEEGHIRAQVRDWKDDLEDKKDPDEEDKDTLEVLTDFLKAADRLEEYIVYVKPKKGASLRIKVLKLALANPELQPHLYPILKAHR